MKQRESWLSALRGLLAPVACAVVLMMFFTAVNCLERGRADEGRGRLEDSLRRAAAACYAAEGIYPPDLAYLQAHYGIQVDEARYTVDYEVFGSNLMPDITVLENGA
ncbi:hypothetical protein [Dysosmobacter sp.]